MNNIIVFISIGIFFLLFILYSYNKNIKNNDDDLDEYIYELDEEYNNIKYKHHNKKRALEIQDTFPLGKSFRKNPNTGLNKFGCNCVCHDGTPMHHIAPCCGIKQVCGCPCHLGIYIDHNQKCCDNAIID